MEEGGGGGGGYRARKKEYGMMCEENKKKEAERWEKEVAEGKNGGAGLEVVNREGR